MNVPWYFVIVHDNLGWLNTALQHTILKLDVQLYTFHKLYSFEILIKTRSKGVQMYTNCTILRFLSKTGSTVVQMKTLQNSDYSETRSTAVKMYDICTFQDIIWNNKKYCSYSFWELFWIYIYIYIYTCIYEKLYRFGILLSKARSAVKRCMYCFVVLLKINNTL